MKKRNNKSNPRNNSSRKHVKSNRKSKKIHINTGKMKEIPSCNKIISLADEIDVEIRNYFENLLVVQDEWVDQNIQEIGEPEMVLMQAEIVILQTIWLLYPDRYYNYLRSIKNIDRISNSVIALSKLIQNNEINFFLDFIYIEPLQINSQVIKRYNKVKNVMKKLLKKQKLKNERLDRLSDKLSEIGTDFASFWDQSKNHQDLPEQTIEKFGLEDPINLMWYFELTSEFYNYAIPTYEAIEEDRINLMNALYKILVINDEQDEELGERMREEIQGMDYNFIGEDEDEIFLPSDSEYIQEYENFVTYLENENDYEAEKMLIKSNPEKFTCSFVIICSGINDILNISLFIIPLTKNNNLNDAHFMEPFEAFSISWNEFEDDFTNENKDWKNYSKTKLTKVMKEASEHIRINAMGYVLELLDDVKVPIVNFSMTKHILVDFDKHDVKPMSRFPKKFNLEIGKILKDTLVREITELGFQITYVDMNEEEYLEENEFSNFSSFS